MPVLAGPCTPNILNMCRRRLLLGRVTENIMTFVLSCKIIPFLYNTLPQNNPSLCVNHYEKPMLVATAIVTNYNGPSKYVCQVEVQNCELMERFLL